MISIFTAASTTTSRAESVNSECKLFFKKPEELNSIFAFVEHHTKKIQIKYKRLNNADRNIINKKPLLKHCNISYSEFGIKLLYDQYLESLSYVAGLLDDSNNTKTFKVYRKGLEESSRSLQLYKNSFNIICSCKTITFSGILCKHSISLIMADKIDFTQLNINLRWQKKCNDDLIIIENNDSSLNVAKAPESSNQQSAD